jgi:hypothetical protein
MPNPHVEMCGRCVPYGVDAWRPFADDEPDVLLGDVLPFLNGAEPDSLTWTGDVWDASRATPTPHPPRPAA